MAPPNLAPMLEKGKDMAKNDNIKNKPADDAATPTPPTGQTEIAGKLSAKKLFGKLPKPEAQTILYVAFGIADGIRTGESTYGAWEGLSGQFEFVSQYGETAGKAYFGTQAFLPKNAHEMIATVLRHNAEKNDGDMGSVEFAIEVGYKPSDVAVGYEFTVRPIGKVRGADPLAAIRAQALQLPAPDSAK
jgi:hypothetical protein